MSDMIERVKDALRTALASCDSENASGMGVTEWEADMLARAAIKAMREPTEGMIHAGRFWPRMTNQQETGLPLHNWQAMIDAALKVAPPIKVYHTNNPHAE